MTCRRAELADLSRAEVGSLFVTADGHRAWRKTGPRKTDVELQRPSTTIVDSWEGTGEGGPHVFRNLTRAMAVETFCLYPPEQP